MIAARMPADADARLFVLTIFCYVAGGSSVRYGTVADSNEEVRIDFPPLGRYVLR